MPYRTTSRRYTEPSSDEDTSSSSGHDGTMSKEGFLHVLVRNAQSLQNVERFGYSDPHVILEVEGGLSREEGVRNWPL